MRIGVLIVRALMRRFQRAGGALFLAAALICVIALLGLLDSLSGELTPLQTVALAIAALIVVGLVTRRRTVRILPFANLGTGDAKNELEPVVAGLAEQLDVELRRIGRLGAGNAVVSVRDLYPGGELYARGFDQRAKPGVQPSAGKLGGGYLRSAGAAGVGAGPGADIGTLSVGPVRLQLGWLVGLLSRSFAQVIAGKVFVSGGEIVLVAEHSSGQHWESRCALDDADPAVRLPTLSRELAAQIARHFERAEVGGDWRALLEITDGLDHLDCYRVTADVEALERAIEALLAAVTRSPQYARACYCLGIAYQERERLRSQSVSEQAVVMWEHALRLDPAYPEAHVALAQAKMEEGDVFAAESLAKQGIELLRGQRRSTSIARYVLADALFRQALGFSVDADDAGVRAVDQLHLAYSEFESAAGSSA